MKVIGASRGRTGTTSAAAALNLLGLGPCVQMQTMWEQPDLAAFAELWPRARVLLTLRDAESWYDSVRASIYAWTAPGKDVGPPAVAQLLARVWDAGFGGWDRVLDRQWAIERYESHVRAVRRECPPQRLVEWRVADGWAPLCEQLGVDVPNEPVPHLNAR